MDLKRTIIPDDWNPLEVAYNSSYNSYNSGPGANLDRSLQLPRRVTYTGSEQDFRLYVSNISPNVTEVGLKNMFSNFGEPRSVKIVHGKSGKGNIGFVSFSTLREAQMTISELHKTPPYFLNVSFANPSERMKSTSERNEFPNFINEYELPEESFIELDPEYLTEENDIEGAVGCELFSGCYHEINEYEAPSATKLQWTCNKDGQRVIIGRGSHQKYGCRYSLPDTSEDRRRRIEAIIREKVYYNRKNNGIYEYGEEEPEESNVGPCTYCNKMTSMVCEQCSTTLYCSSRCQMKDFPNHKTICGSSVDLRISKEGEKRCVAVKLGEDTNYVNSKSPEKNYTSHDKKYDRCSTDRSSIPDKLNESNTRFREKSLTETSKETDRHVMSSGMRVDIQVHNKSSVIRDDYQCKRGNFDGNNAFHNRYNRSDKLGKNKLGSNKKESSNDKNVEAKSRAKEKVMDCNPLQKLQVDRHGKNYNADNHNQSRYDKKNSTDSKDFRKNNNKDNMDCTEVIKTLDNSKCKSQKVCTKTENDSQDLSPGRLGEQNVVAGTQVKSRLPFDVFTEVIISYVGERGEFWVQKHADIPLIKSVTEGLSEEIINAVTLEAPKQKSKCAAKYADEWYRGRVVSTDPLKVQFVDWGNTEELSSVDDIKVLPEKFCTYPPMACKIHLADGTPDEYMRKKEFETLKVKPLSKATDGAVVVQVEGVEEASRGSLEQECLQPKSDSVHEMQTTEEFSRTEEPDLSFMTKQSKQDASHELEKPKKLFPTEDLEFNTPTEVEICKIEEQSYWVTLQSRKEEFSELLFVLQAVAEKSNPLLPSVNDLCIAVYENVWTRGYVKDVAELEVFFFDLGETAKCSVGSIRELPVQFHVYPPALAHKLCFVEGTPNKYLNKKEGDCLTVKPISKCDDGSWLVEVEGADHDIPIQTCKQLDCSTDENILAHGAYTEVLLVEKQSENIFYVQPQTMLATLCEMSKLLFSSAKREDFKPRVGTLCASLYEDVWCRCRVMCISLESVSVFYIDFGNTEENVLLERLQPIPEKYVSIPPQAVLVKVVQEDFNENLTLYNKYFVRPVSKLSNGIPVVHIRKDYIQSEENVISMTIAHQEKCVSDERMQLQPVHIQPNTTVKISYICDTSTIYVQLTDKKSVDIMEEILQEIGSHCQTAPLLDTQPLVADLVACRYSKDNNWYRAEILGRQEDKFHILFVDYGNKAVVTLDSIKSLPDKYKNVPAQCVKIGLADCTTTELTPAAQQCLFEFIHQTLIVDFKNDDLSSVILKTEDGLVVNEKLKDHIIPSWKKALLQNEDPTRNKLFFMEDLENATLPQDKVIMLKALMYCPPDILIVCNISTDLYKYVTTTLTDEISDYCNSLPEQAYNPRLRELCCVTMPTACKKSKMTSELDEDAAEHGCRKWYRAVCLESKVESSLLSLVDFGKQLYAPHNCIRRFVPDFISTPAMACFCNMEGIPEQPSEKLIEKLKSIIQQNKMYEVTVIKKQANTYSIHVPYIIDTVKAEKLL